MGNWGIELGMGGTVICHVKKKEDIIVWGTCRITASRDIQGEGMLVVLFVVGYELNRA